MDFPKGKKIQHWTFNQPNLYNNLMLSFLLEFALMLGASLLTLILSYYKISITIYQQIIIFLMLMMLIIYNRLFSSQSKIFPTAVLIKIILFTTALFIQLLIISTGGVFSPFLILLHLFVLGVSFLLEIKTAFSFLLFSTVTLAIHSLLNPFQLQLVRQDLGTVLVYILSFVVIIPLAQFIAKKYHLKEELSTLLSKQVKVWGSILESMNELVLITDPSLRLIFINEAAEKLLSLNQDQAKGIQLFDAISLKDKQGNPANSESLPISTVLTDKASRIVSGFYLYTKNRATPYSVSIQIRPIISGKGDIEQLSFVMTEGVIPQDQQHSDLVKARAIENLRLENLKKELQSLGLTDLSSQLELINKAEQDLRLVQELEDHPIKEQPVFTDVAFLTNDIFLKKQTFAKFLGVELSLVLGSAGIKEESFMSLKKSDINPRNLPISDYAVPIDSRWLEILIEKIVDLSILLSSTIRNSRVQILFNLEDKEYMRLYIISNCPKLSRKELKELFDKYYGKLTLSTNLKYGSGMEGFIANAISSQLNIPIQVQFSTYPNRTTFVISIPRKARPNS